MLPPSYHRDMALSLVEAWSHHLSSQPGGWNYNPSGTLGKVAYPFLYVSIMFSSMPLPFVHCYLQISVI